MNDKPEPTQDAGRWRFSRLDGRFVFDFDDGRKGFHSPLFKDAEAFAVYATRLEAENAALTRERDAAARNEDALRLRVREAEAELETLRAKAALCAELLDELPPCDIDRSWCLTHQANGCQVDVIRARYDALSAEASPAVVEEPKRPDLEKGRTVVDKVIRENGDWLKEMADK